jgi:hypothetical protein
MARGTVENPFNMVVTAQQVNDRIFVSVNNRANVVALDIAAATLAGFDVGMESTGVVALTYGIRDDEAVYQRISTDGGRTWANR